MQRLVVYRYFAICCRCRYCSASLSCRHSLETFWIVREGRVQQLHPHFCSYTALQYCNIAVIILWWCSGYSPWCTTDAVVTCYFWAGRTACVALSCSTFYLLSGILLLNKSAYRLLFLDASQHWMVLADLPELGKGTSHWFESRLPMDASVILQPQYITLHLCIFHCFACSWIKSSN